MLQIKYYEELERLRKWVASCIAMNVAYVVALVSILCRLYRVSKSFLDNIDYEQYALMQRITTMDDKDYYCHAPNPRVVVEVSFYK